VQTPEASTTNASDAEERYESEVHQNLNRNFLVLLAHGMLGMTGFRLLQAPTFLPAYVALLSGSDVVVGVVLAAQHIGSAIASIPSGSLISRRQRILPLFMGIGTLMRLQVLGIALTGSWLLTITCLFLFLFGLFSGMQGVMFQYSLSKLIPLKVRGRLTGFRNLVSGVVSSIVAMLGGSYFIDANVWGNGYATTFLLAFILTSLGLLALLGLEEPETPNMPERTKLSAHLRQLPTLMKAENAFVRFVAARCLASLAAASVPFYILYAGEQISLTGTDLGTLTVAFLLIQTLFNFVWGAIADRYGNRLVFVISLLPGSLFWLVVAFSGLGVGLGGFMIGSMNLILEFGRREDLPMLIGVSNAANSVVFAVGPILGGLLAAFSSYEILIIVTIGLKAASIIVTLAFVPEPRNRKAPQP
jgi:MFS family permease